MANRWTIAKFANVFPRQRFALYGTSLTLIMIPSSTTPGENLQLLDDDDDDIDNQSTEIPTGSSSALSDQPRRYPTTEFQRKSARYADGHQ